MKLLHIYALAEGQNSRTLSISEEFLKALKEQKPDLEVTSLNVLTEDLPDVYGMGANAKYSVMGGQHPEGAPMSAWEKISVYCQDFLDHDAYLLSIPMWNFSLPYMIKHYIDVIIQPGFMFRFTAEGVEGLVKDKKMYVVSTRGSDYSPEGPMAQYDLVTPYIRTIFGFVGIYDISFVNAQPLDYTPELAQMKIEEAKAEAIAMAQGA